MQCHLAFAILKWPKSITVFFEALQMPSAGLTCFWNLEGGLLMTHIQCRCALSHLCLFMPSSVDQHPPARIKRRAVVCTACARGDWEGSAVMHLISSSWRVDEEGRRLGKNIVNLTIFGLFLKKKRNDSDGSSLQQELIENLFRGRHSA